MENKTDTDDHLPVFDAEIVDEREDAKIMPAKAKLPEKKIAYRLGKAAGTIFTALGLFNEFRRMLRREYPGGSSNRSGRGMGIRKRNKRKGKMRRFT